MTLTDLLRNMAIADTHVRAGGGFFQSSAGHESLVSHQIIPMGLHSVN